MTTGPTEIQLDVAGTLTLDPPEPYRPSAATVTLYTPAGVEHVASQSATLDAVNTTLSAEASEGDTTLTLTSVANIAIGRRYILAVTGAEEWVKVTGVTTATKVVTLAEGLLRDVANGAGFVSNRLTVAVTSGQATPLDEGYEARWTYTVGSTTYRATTTWDVTRAVWSTVIAAPWEFREYALALGARNLQLATGEGLDFADELERATALVRADIRDRQLRPGLFRAPSGFKLAIYERVLLSWAESGINIPMAWQQNVEGYLTVRRERYGQTLAQALSTTPYDADESGAVGDRERGARLGSIRIGL